MKVLLANPPAYLWNHRRHFIQAGSRWSHSFLTPTRHKGVQHYLPYPFFLGYASALLKRDTVAQVKAIDTCALDFDETEFVSYVRRYDPDLLVVEVPTVSFPLVMKLLAKLKDQSDCKIAVAGHHATAMPTEVISGYPFIDYILLNEYELTLKELVDCMEKGKEPQDVNGICYRDNGRIIMKPYRPILKDLDLLPFPDREDMPIEPYIDAVVVGTPVAQMLTSRGCPVGCSFCVYIQVLYENPAYRRRNPEKIADEMELVKEKYHARQVYFDDDTMTIHKNHINELCRELIGRKIDIPWTAMGDVTLGRNTLELMKRAGCVGLKFGVESVKKESLRQMHKGMVTMERVLRFRRWCRELSLWTHATYSFGHPADTVEGIRETIKFAIKLDTESAQFSIATPFPGTPFFDYVKENDWLVTDDWTMYDGNNYAVVEYPWLSKVQIECLTREAIKAMAKHSVKKRIKNLVFHPSTVLNKCKVRGTYKTLKDALSALSAALS